MPKIIECKVCKKKFKIKKGGKVKFCSSKCYWKFLKSKYNGNNGNKYPWTRSFGRRTYVHRAVVEKNIGRKLVKGEIVHHKNFNRDDNRLENLQVMSQSEHIKIHMIYEE